MRNLNKAFHHCTPYSFQFTSISDRVLVCGGGGRLGPKERRTYIYWNFPVKYRFTLVGPISDFD